MSEFTDFLNDDLFATAFFGSPARKTVFSRESNQFYIREFTDGDNDVFNTFTGLAPAILSFTPGTYSLTLAFRVDNSNPLNHVFDDPEDFTTNITISPVPLNDFRQKVDFIRFLDDVNSSNVAFNDFNGDGLNDVFIEDLGSLTNLFVDDFDRVANILDTIFLVAHQVDPANSAAFGGNDRFYLGGGDNYLVDLLGNNNVNSREGNDHILFGDGNDRLFDRGGDNFVRDTGGDNFFTLDDGNDTVLTGDGRDNISARDGRNLVDAGEGNNFVRGGRNFDELHVGTGDDYVDVRGGFDFNEAAETGDLPNENEVESFLFRNDVTGGLIFIPSDQTLGAIFTASNIVFDRGGSDRLKSFEIGGFGDDVFLSDLNFTEDVTLVEQEPGLPALRRIAFDDVGVVLGDDFFGLGGGNNVVIDGGGNNLVRTVSGSGSGDDIIYTSLFSSGDDIIDGGSGNDFIDSGAGTDSITGGAGRDTINVGAADGDSDTLVYLEGDVTFSANATDRARGFEGFGVDKLDVSALGVNLGMVRFVQVGPGLGDPAQDDVLIAWDTDANGEFNFFTTILEDFDLGTLTPDNFLLA